MGPAPPLSIDVESRNGVQRITLRGEIDLSTVGLLEGALSERDGSGSPTIMLDLRDVTFMDSTGLHTLLGARRRSEQDGSSLVLLAVSPAARRVFEVSGVGDMLDHDAMGALDRFTAGMSANGHRRIGDESVV
jgi:anti-sigma B factor antagonist